MERRGKGARSCGMEMPWAASGLLSHSPSSKSLMGKPKRKDPRAFFSFPMTDHIASDRSMVGRHPVDFSTIKDEIKNKAISPQN